jgi:hypothetical protein
LTAATPISVTAGSVTAGRDFSLDRGGTISGTVSNAMTSSYLPGVFIYLYERSTTGTAVYVDETDSSFLGGGYYRFAGLPTRIYYVYTRNFTGFIDEIFDNVACSGLCQPQDTVTQGTGISISGANTRAADIRLTPTRFPVFSKTAPGHNHRAADECHLVVESNSVSSFYEYCYDTIDNNSCDGTWVGASQRPAWRLAD